MLEPIGGEFVLAKEYSTGGIVGIKLFQGPSTYLTEKVAIESTRPSYVNPIDAYGILVKEYGGPTTVDGRSIVNMAPIGNLFSRISPSNRLVRALGYNFVEQQDFDGRGVTNRQTFEYPTTQRVNDVVKVCFPGENSIKFADFPGGFYPPLRFMRSYINDGEVLVASEQPYTYHDHAALHVLGWIGVGGGFSQKLRERLTPYMVRLEAETKLPKLPDEDMLGNSDYFNPTRAFVKATMSVLDGLSSAIAEKYFQYDDSVNELAIYFQNLLISAGGLRGGPQIFVGYRNRDEALIAASEVVSRYSRIIEFLSRENSEAQSEAA